MLSPFWFVAVLTTDQQKYMYYTNFPAPVFKFGKIINLV